MRPWELLPAHATDLLRLQRVLESAQGQGFRLLLAEWNQLPDRDALIRHLGEAFSGNALLTLTQDWPPDYAAVLEQIESLGRNNSLVQVIGFENWRLSRPEAFKQLNHRREEIAARCPSCLLWWLVPDDLRTIAMEAPDFWAWRTAVLDFTHTQELPAIAQDRLNLTTGPTQSEKQERLTEILAYLSENQELSAHTQARLHREAGDILETLGRWEDAMHHLTTAEQQFRAADDIHSASHSLRVLAVLDFKRGHVIAALERLEKEVLPLFLQLGDNRSRAITLGDIAQIRADMGEVDVALALHQEELEVYKCLGDKHSRAVTLGDIARIRAAKGEVEAALALHQERLVIFEDLGDKRERAVTLGDIARIRAAKGNVDAALALYQEMLGIFEGLGDKRSRAVTLGDIARIHADKGEVDAALALHLEELDVYESLDDKRSRAVTLGNIARIHADKGEVDMALALNLEMLDIFESLGDKDGKANTLWSIAKIEVKKQEWQAAFEHFAAAYAINLQLSRLDGICYVGLDLGQLLCAVGRRDEGVVILQRSLAGFQKLGWASEIAETEAILKRLD